jgi:hypothetical protein
VHYYFSGTNLQVAHHRTLLHQYRFLKAVSSMICITITNTPAHIPLNCIFLEPSFCLTGMGHNTPSPLIPNSQCLCLHSTKDSLMYKCSSKLFSYLHCMDEFSDMLRMPVVTKILREKNQFAATFKTFQDTQ